MAGAEGRGEGGRGRPGWTLTRLSTVSTMSRLLTSPTCMSPMRTANFIRMLRIGTEGLIIPAGSTTGPEPEPAAPRGSPMAPPPPPPPPAPTARRAAGCTSSPGPGLSLAIRPAAEEPRSAAAPPPPVPLSPPRPPPPGRRLAAPASTSAAAPGPAPVRASAGPGGRAGRLGRSPRGVAAEVSSRVLSQPAAAVSPSSAHGSPPRRSPLGSLLPDALSALLTELHSSLSPGPAPRGDAASPRLAQSSALRRGPKLGPLPPAPLLL